ncbi:MAG: GNAT family N-acetyltransferase [Leptolyngbyaceae cyanobacterium]
MTHIRQATPKDADRLVHLSQQTFFEAFAADNDPADMEYYLAEVLSPERICSELMADASIFLLLSHNAESPPIGYARLLGNSSEPCVTGTHLIELVRLYIQKSAIGQGYGSQLMWACLEKARQHGFKTIWLGVWEKNYRAQRFYQRWGFRQVGTHEFVLGKNKQTDFILMRTVETKDAAK